MLEAPAEFRKPLPTSDDEDDAGLIEVERRQIAFLAWLNDTKGKTDDDIDRLSDLDTLHEDFIAETPAHTFAGVAVKLRALLRHTLSGSTLDGGSTRDWTGDCIKTALAMLEQMGERPRVEPPFDVSAPAPTPGSDRALVEAERRMLALEEFWNEQPDPPNNAYGVEMSALRRFVAETPAIGAEGVLPKFKCLLSICDIDEESSVFVPALVNTVTEALKRMAR